MTYRFTEPPLNQHDMESLLRWLRTELLEIEATLDILQTPRINLVPQNSEPQRPRTGDIARADGTNWNPGSGEGVYEYDSGGTWNKL